MRKCFAIVSTLAALSAMVATASADNRVSVSKKGSLLMYSKVELRWAFEENGMEEPGYGWHLVQDTILDISNDYPQDVNVQFYFVNGDAPADVVCAIDCQIVFGDRCVEIPQCIVEREHPGWNWVDCEVPLTANQPTYMSMYSGYPAGCQPFTELDPGYPPGRPDPSDPETRVLRGFVYAWAVKNDTNDGQNVQIRWNHLVGDAIIINYEYGTAAEYNAYAAQVVETLGGPGNGDFVGTAGTLNLDGEEYDIAFRRVLFDFYASDPRGEFFDTDITLHPVSADLRQETDGPVKTKAVVNIWNEDETRFSGTEKCIECWDQTFASDYPAPNHFTIEVLGTLKGKARVEGIASNIPACPLAVDAALLGLQIKHAMFGERFMTTSALTMVGQGEYPATIKYDIIPGSDEAQDMASAGLGGAGVKSGRTGR
jgi:hypothetical protein